MYWTILQVLQRPHDNHRSSHVIRELFETERCDSFYSLKDLRDDHKNHLGAHENIMNFKTTAENED